MLVTSHINIYVYNSKNKTYIDFNYKTSLIEH